VTSCSLCAYFLDQELSHITIATHLAAAAAAIVVVVVVVLFLLLLVQGATSSTKPKAPIRRFKSDLDEI